MDSSGRFATLCNLRDESAWRDRVKAHLAAQIAEDGKLYGYRKDGAYVVRTKDGDQSSRQGTRAARTSGASNGSNGDRYLFIWLFSLCASILPV